MKNRDQTVNSFRDKWEKNTQLAFAETLKEGSDIFNWILNRNGCKSADDFRAWLKPRTRILDAGCGNGRVTALLRRYAPVAAEITGIDIAAADVARENLRGEELVQFQQADLLGNLEPLGAFDLIYSQEVLHHTADPKGAFLNLCQRLAPGGEIAIYVYKVKAPMREYADDYIRDRVSGLSYDDAMAAMRGITELGKVLSESGAKVKVPAVPLLGIKGGEYEFQRFLYHFFLKCFWNPDLSFEENAAINYDWYHPQLCTRHTLEEIEGWFEQAGLRIVHRCVDHYGITVRGIASM
jgi:SAM-dependent methyltransferase